MGRVGQVLKETKVAVKVVKGIFHRCEDQYSGKTSSGLRQQHGIHPWAHYLYIKTITVIHNARGGTVAK